MTRSTSQVEIHEAGLQLRTVVVEFDSYDTAVAARESEAYQKVLQVLGSAAERDFRIVEGVWSPAKLGWDRKPHTIRISTEHAKRTFSALQGNLVEESVRAELMELD